MFRDAALAADRPQWLGEVLLIPPTSLRVAAVASAVVAVATVMLLVWGTYTHRATVVGRLVPSAGFAKVYAPSVGVVIERHVAEGQRVNEGDVLFVLSAERRSAAGDGVGSQVARRIEARVASLQEDLTDMTRMHSIALETQRQTIAARSEELAKLDGLIQSQRERVALASANAHRYARLLARSYVSREQSQEKRATYLEQRAQFQSLQRERVVMTRTLIADRQRLDALPHAQHRELAQRTRELALLKQELTESEGKRAFSVIAPADGIATTVMSEVGQTVTVAMPLMSIVPVDSRLEAHLYVTSDAVGFMQAGDPVRLRYRAFAHQKFGQFPGTVTSVSWAALPHAEIADIDPYEGRKGTQTPLYLVKVRLDDSSAHAGIRPLVLRAGMQLDADVMRETRRLYEWAFHPLQGLRQQW
ncbi:Colicin V secretion protein CvaA [Pandoraea iniqua]|uniref:Colicin V secretion protein CvaA n=1 Tax=Pandoraea iniqua TaxID=2508288 RepID=A0A5E4S9I2_9BURK|nr:HlyD family secretion protein [Pandoraea iniqua]VVD70689.1 Colicin V secretion protein CvaA [Pandoraea iniqua]